MTDLCIEVQLFALQSSAFFADACALSLIHIDTHHEEQEQEKHGDRQERECALVGQLLQISAYALVQLLQIL